MSDIIFSLQRGLDDDVRKLEKKLSSLRSSEVDRAHARALNEGTKRARTKIVRATAGEVNVKSKSIRSKISIIRATSSNKEARMRVKRSSVSAMSQGARKTKTGVTAGRRKFAGAFIAAPTSSPVRPDPDRKPLGKGLGKLQVFKRTGKKRYPLAAVKIWIRDEITRATNQAVREVTGDDIQKILARDLNYRIEKLVSKHA